MSTITLNGIEYPLATTLRVAYEVQGQNNHRSYIDVFSDIGEMKLEEQISILYVAFKVANPDEAKTMKEVTFRNAMLDDPNFTISSMFNLLKEVVEQVMGKDIVDKAKNDSGEAPGTEGNE